MKYMGMNKKEFIEYAIKMTLLFLESQQEQKNILKELGLGEHYDQ